MANMSATIPSPGTGRCRPSPVFPLALTGLLAIIAMLGLLAAPRPCAAEAGATSDGAGPESPYFFIEDGDPAVDRLPLERTDVKVDVTGVIANVRVRQAYKNTGSRPISARYLFPASTRAAVHGMRMRIGQQVIEAQVQEKKRAEQTFERAKREGKSASLLEQQRPNVFSMRVANVMPGDRIEVELDYTEMLVPEDGQYEFVYPTVVGPRYPGGGRSPAPAPEAASVSTAYLHETEEAPYGFHIEGRLTTGVPLQYLDVPTHRVTTETEDASVARFALAKGQERSGDRDFILRYGLSGGQVESGLLLYDGKAAGSKPGDQEGFFLLTVQPPARVPMEAMPAREYVFVLDVSGSMHGFPLDTAKQVIRDLVLDLRPVDSFNVMLFSGASKLLWPASRNPTEDNLRDALAVIDGEQGAGSTELLSALQRALAMPSQRGTSRSFIVVTDGYISAERDVFEYVRAHAGDANVFSFGIGSGVNRYLVEGLARAGFGEPFIVTDPGTSQVAAQRFAEYVRTPVLTDLRFLAEDFDVYDVQPKTLPDLMASRPIVVMGKWRGNPKGRLIVRGDSPKGAYTKTIDVTHHKPDVEASALSRLWARTRIAELSDFSFGRESDGEREQITKLGLRYNLLTAHTSFVAVARQVRNPGGQSQAVDQPLPLPVGVSDRAVAAPMYGAPEPELWLLLMVLAVGIFVGTLRRRGSWESR